MTPFILLLPLIAVVVASPIVATVLGWVAVAQIRRSQGRLCGLGLAVFDGLLFPLLALDALIVALCTAVTRMFVAFYANPALQNRPDVDPALVTKLANLLAGHPFLLVPVIAALVVVVDVLIVHAVWRAVNKSATPPVPPAVAPPRADAKVPMIGKTGPADFQSLEKSATPGVVAVGGCAVTTYERLATAVGQWWLPQWRGQLVLDERQLAFSGSAQHIVIPLAAIRDLSFGRFSRWLQPAGLNFISVTYDGADRQQRLILVPVEGPIALISQTNRLIADWHGKIRTATTRATGRAPGSTPADRLGLPRFSTFLLLALVPPLLAAAIGLALLVINMYQPEIRPMAPPPSAARSWAPQPTHVGNEHGTVFVTHDNVDVFYALFYPGQFGMGADESFNPKERSWHSKGSIELNNGKKFLYLRVQDSPETLRLNGDEFDLRQGRVIVLHDDGTAEQLKLFPPLATAQAPAALAGLIQSVAAAPERVSRLQFRLVAGTNSAEAVDDFPEPGGGPETVRVLRDVLLDETAIASATVTNIASGAPEMAVTLTEAGAKQMARITRENLNRRLAIIFDGVLLSAPTIRSEITGGRAVITGRFSPSEALAMALVLNRGSVNEQQPPVVVETFPVSGAQDVPAGETEIRVRFSKPMRDRSWSWCYADEGALPELVGDPHYEADGRTCVVRARLEAGRTYAIWLNAGKFKGFADESGRPAVPYLLTFKTRKP